MQFVAAYEYFQNIKYGKKEKREISKKKSMLKNITHCSFTAFSIETITTCQNKLPISWTITAGLQNKNDLLVINYYNLTFIALNLWRY